MKLHKNNPSNKSSIVIRNFVILGYLPLSWGYIQSNLSLGATQGKGKMWLLKTGDPLIQVHLHCILDEGAQKRLVLKTGDPLIEVTT